MTLREAPSELGFGDNRLRCNAGRFIAAARADLDARAAPSAIARGGSAATPVGSEPQSTTATFGDWVLRCVREAPPDRPQRVCEVAQTLEVKGQGVVAQIALRRLSPKEPMRMTIALPPNVSLSSKVRVSVTDKDENPVELEWKRCLPGACVAEGEVRDDLVRSWRAQTECGADSLPSRVGATARLELLVPRARGRSRQPRKRRGRSIADTDDLSARTQQTPSA